MSTQTKATPGPWRFKNGAYDFGNDGERYIVHSAADHPHAQICLVASQIERKRKTPYNEPDAERDANSRLLAAAPELLAALEYALECLLRLKKENPDYECFTLGAVSVDAEARAALAKAKGNQ